MSDADMAMDTESPSTSKAKQTRQRSAIAFSYVDLADIMAVVDAVHSQVGSGECDEHQLSVWIAKSHKSSTFRITLSNARLFDLLDVEGERIKLTPLGRRAVDPAQAREALANAFLSVPLYKAIFEKYKGGVLPPTAALEREMAQIGVAEKQVRTARLVMERSADYAHFFEHGKDRLVMPGVTPSSRNDQASTGDEPPPVKSIGGGGDEPPRHPLMEGMFRSLPPDGTLWSLEEAADWLQAAAYNLRFAYKFKGRIRVEIEAPQ